MKRFTLIVKVYWHQTNIKNKRQYLATHDRAIPYDVMPIFRIKKDDPSVDMYIAIQTNNFSEIKGIIETFYDTKSIEIIVLFDDEQDIAHIYKCKGSLQNIKNGILPPLVEIYEETFGIKNAFFAINDIRVSMMFRNMSMN
ncbi:MAG: hypothetical protein WC010_02575 [Candidatus Absconditabacterales bacterium]